jgi:hypothetical protein
MSLPVPVQAVMPSLEFAESGYVYLKVPEFEVLLEGYLAAIPFDETWYLSQYPDIRQAQESGTLGMTPAEHYRRRGYIEGRLPFEPKIDEDAYKAKYPDVAQDIKAGILPNALHHFINSGYREMRDALVKEHEALLSVSDSSKAARRAAPTFRRSGL